MRKPRHVIGAALLLACGVALAQDAAGGGAGGLTGEFTVIGRDDAVIPVPPPVPVAAMAIPPFDPEPGPAVNVPAVIPAASFPQPPVLPDPKDVVDDALSR